MMYSTRSLPTTLVALNELVCRHQQTKPPGQDDENCGNNFFGDFTSSNSLMEVLYYHHRLQVSFIKLPLL